MSDYIGMNAHTGLRLSDNEHLAQSIKDILTTPVGSRIERREYGSLLPELIDAPTHARTLIQVYAAAATAIMRWEPRLRLTRISTDTMTSAGQVTLSIEGNRTRSGVAFSSAIVIAGGR